MEWRQVIKKEVVLEGFKIKLFLQGPSKKTESKMKVGPEFRVGFKHFHFDITGLKKYS